MSDKTTEDKKVKSENKADRVARMEDKIDRLEKGLLVLINLVAWNNDTITPLGTHNPSVDAGGYSSIDAAIEDHYPEPEDDN